MPDHLNSTLSLTVAQKSVTGKKADNEDAIGIRIPTGTLLNTKGAVSVIADGVSAAEAGKEASETCVRNFLSDYYSTPDSWGAKKSTSQVLTALNRWLFGLGRQYTQAQKGYVSTFSALILKSQTAHIFHVGDSRVYRLQGGDLEQLTRDHTTYVSESQTYLARAMGLDLQLDVDYRSVNLEAGDVFLLTTDGIHDFLRQQELRTLLTTINCETSESALENICETLIDSALEKGSNDNLSCQLLRVDALPAQTINDISQKLTELPFPPELDRGMVLDGYRIERELHASNRSQVYLVVDQATDQRYCMKTPSVNFEDDPAYIERFVMESWIGSRINNSHVVKVVEPSRRKSCLYYLTEYIDGQTLEQWIKENPKPPVQEVIFLVEQITAGLRALHRKEVLHRDLKPGNIIIDTNGEVKIIDFGSCHVQGIAEINTPIEHQGVLGTASYSAPETVISTVSSVKSDIFSLAVIVYEMLTGQQPFSGKLSECRSTKAYLKTKYIPCFDHNPLIPIWLDGAVKKGLRLDPERRYNDVSEFLYELQNPNPKYKTKQQIALVDRNPLIFWQITSGILFIALCVSLAWKI